MHSQEKLEALFAEHAYTDFKWMKPVDIVVSQWVRMKCLFGFEKTVDKPEDRHTWSKRLNQKLLKLERAVFLAGHEKAFLLAMDSCGMCADCPGVREACKHPQAARPSPESMAVDVFATVRKYGYPIEVLSGYSRVMNRYAFLLIE